MLSRFSVKKPYIVTVAVIIILILGGVSLTKMKTDLLPDMDLPYLAVITTDPGASAEKVESEVTDVLEGSLSKVSGVSSVQSQSADIPRVRGRKRYGFRHGEGLVCGKRGFFPAA